MRNLHLMIYGSSYDRGLEHLLNMWPEIKKEVPDAELHVFYGWNLFDLGYADNPERMAWKAKINKLMEQPGITHLGRISHGACIKEHEMAGIWTYPTNFGEISCITAMRAQVYGSVPCVINYAALRETVKWGVKIEGDVYEPEVKKLYCDALIALLKDEKYQEEVRKEMMPEARKLFAWSSVAKQWDEEFKRVITPEETAMKLILRDEPLEAIKILPEGKLRIKLLKKLDHIFNYDKYLEKYANDPMNWKPESIIQSRHDWILSQVSNPRSLIDLGCYEGSLVTRAKEKGVDAKGVEMCKAAVKLAKERKINVVEGDACTYQDGNKYDAVCACELIEHVPDPEALIKNMLSLVTSDGWCYLTTPNGCYDPEGTRKVWNDENALIDHVRTYSGDKMKKLLDEYDGEIKVNGKEIWVKFRRSLTREVEKLMEDNQALKAWDLVKDTNSPLKERVWLRVKHAFDSKEYKKYYSEDLIEIPVSEEIALDCTKLAPRFAWVIPKILALKPMTLLDLGCADGYLCLTVAKKLPGTYCNGWNLYKPSIDRAVELSSKYKLLANFRCDDLFNYDGDTADVVVMMEVLEHLPDPQKGVDHAMSLLDEGGTAFFSTPRTDHLGVEQHKAEVGHKSWDDGKPSGHLRLFTEEEFRNLFKKYKIVKFYLDEERCMTVEVKQK